MEKADLCNFKQQTIQNTYFKLIKKTNRSIVTYYTILFYLVLYVNSRKKNVSELVYLPSFHSWMNKLSGDAAVAILFQTAWTLTLLWAWQMDRGTDFLILLPDMKTLFLWNQTSHPRYPDSMQTNARHLLKYGTLFFTNSGLRLF